MSFLENTTFQAEREHLDNTLMLIIQENEAYPRNCAGRNTTSQEDNSPLDS
jgi:hypothetical protein